MECCEVGSLKGRLKRRRRRKRRKTWKTKLSRQQKESGFITRLPAACCPMR